MLAALAATRSHAMTTRTTSKIITFARPFTLKGVDRILPPGEYRVVTDEELIEELSFPVYRRMATMIFVPADSHRASSVEMVTIDPLDLKEAQDRDAEIPEASSATMQSQSGDDSALRKSVRLVKPQHFEGVNATSPELGETQQAGKELIRCDRDAASVSNRTRGCLRQRFC